MNFILWREGKEGNEMTSQLSLTVTEKLSKMVYQIASRCMPFIIEQSDQIQPIEKV